MTELSPITSKEFEKDDLAADYEESDDEQERLARKGVTDQVKSIANRLNDAKITAGPINIYSSDIEMHLDKALKKSRAAGSLNPDGPPDITFAVKCLNPEHKVTADLDKGYFLISGSELGRLNPRQMATWPDN